MSVGIVRKLVVVMFQKMLAGMVGNLIEELGWLYQNQHM